MNEPANMTETDATRSPAPDDPARIARYVDVLQKLDRWVATHLQGGDLGWRQPSSVDGYFSLVLYANAIGRHDWTSRAISHLQRYFLDGSELVQAAKRDAMRAYMPSWIAWAAHEAEYFDFSNLLLDDISTYQDETSGGFFAGRTEREAKQGPLDFDSTTMAVMALARGGRTEKAAKGADFLLNLWVAQPAPDDRFQTAWREPEGLQGVEAGENTVLQWASPKQHYYKVGLFVQALLNAYGATGREVYRDVATQVYDHTVARAADLWTNTISHKMCWAAVGLHNLKGEVTGNVSGQANYLDDACRFADHIVTVQVEDGTFTYPELWPEHPPPKWEMIPNLSCQFGLWIVRVLRLLEARSEVST